MEIRWSVVDPSELMTPIDLFIRTYYTNFLCTIAELPGDPVRSAQLNGGGLITYVRGAASFAEGTRNCIPLGTIV